MTTALHGVGHPWIERPLGGAVLMRFIRSGNRQSPTDGFRLSPSPILRNRVLDLALAHAESVDAELVVANDPDTDRLCVAVSQGNGYRVLNGEGSASSWGIGSLGGVPDEVS